MNVKKLSLVAVSAFLPLALQATPVSAGDTRVTFNTSTLSVLTSAGFSIAAVAPATLSTSPSVSADFPIVGGDTTGDILHSGGLAITRAGTTADLLNFDISTTTNTIFGGVTAGSTTINRLALFDLSVSNGTTNVALDAALAGAINQVFGVALPAGTAIGTAVVTPAAVPEPGAFGLAGLGLVSGLAIYRRRRT